MSLIFSLWCLPGPQRHAAAHLPGPGWLLGPAAALHRRRHCEVWPAAADQEQQLEAHRQSGEEGESLRSAGAKPLLLGRGAQQVKPWQKMHKNDCSDGLKLGERASTSSSRSLFRSYCATLVWDGVETSVVFAVWFSQLFFITSICDYRLSFTATSSRTKEDGSTEERDNEGEIPGPPWQAPTGGPPAPHGSQAGGLLPAELGVGAGGQHRDLYSRSSDETLRRRGPWPRLLPLFPLLTVLILRLFFKTASLSLLSLLHPLSGLNKPSSASFAKRRRSVGCARVSVGLTWVGWESPQLAGAHDGDDDDTQSTHPPIYCP